MTRSHKYNDRYTGEGGTSPDTEFFLPKYFAKTGHVDADPKKTKKETPGESLGNPNATATAGEDKKSLTKTTACEKKPDNTERPTNAQDRAGGPVQRRPEITDGVRLTG